jgi:DNA-binding PadR family transcriptional regulator
MTTRESLGQLEQLTMLAVARLGDDACGGEIQKMLEETTGRSSTLATIYVTLVRLEKKGYLLSRREGPTPVRGGKAKRYFRLTAKGIEALKESRAALEKMWRPVSRLAEFKPR